MIFTLTNLETDLTVHKITGEIHTDTFLKSLRMLQEPVTSRVLWDLREVYSLRRIDPVQLQNFSIHILEMPIKTNGRAALLFASSEDLEIGRQFEAYVRKHQPSFALGLFECMDEARSWLTES